MERTVGPALGSVASALLVAVLLAAFAAESFRDVMLYYGYGTVDPLLAGVMAIVIVVVLAAVRSRRLSDAVRTGIALGLGLAVLLVVSIWALTGRVDVFLARGWMFPAQRWVRVAVSVLFVAGVGLRAWRIGLLPRGRTR